MKPRTFSELFQEAGQHEDYWVAGAIVEFTEDLVREMERQGVTRTELARRLGATPAYVTKILRGKVNFTLATMVRLARALDGEVHVQLTGPTQTAAKRAQAS
jgi:transcriptional regulator with XRE-family HTH domain